MADRFIEAFIDKLILLEQRTGANVQYRVMPPLTLPFNDLLAIQSVAKQIAKFIGLSDLTFVIATAKQTAKVGGHIDLSNTGNDVFVEVSTDMMKFPDAVAATLCHEVCHKWLQVNGIRSPIERENEILTDITSIFLGFGKIMLNGCKTTHVKQEIISSGTRTITETMTAGYLDRDQLAIAYLLVCAMRKISPSDFMQGLNARAAAAVQACESSWGHYYTPCFHEIEKTQKAVADFKKLVVKVQYTMADLDKHVTYSKKSFCEMIDGFLSIEHKKVALLCKKAVAMTEGAGTDPALRFLRAIQADSELNRMKDDIHLVAQEAENLLHHAKDVGLQLYRSGGCFPAPSPEMFNIIKCPRDGTKLRLPENSGELIATCPICKYSFAYNTSSTLFSDPALPRKWVLWKKIRNFMRHHRDSILRPTPVTNESAPDSF